MAWGSELRRQSPRNPANCADVKKESSGGIPAAALGRLAGAVNYRGDALKDSEEVYDPVN